MIQERNKNYYCIVYQTDNVLLFVNKTYKERYEYSAYKCAEFKSKHAAKKIVHILAKAGQLISHKGIAEADEYVIKHGLSQTGFLFMREFYRDLRHIKIMHVTDRIKYC